MHMKACGNVYVCRCGIRLCSLGALKRHCKRHCKFGHEPQLDKRARDDTADLRGCPACNGRHRAHTCGRGAAKAPRAAPRSGAEQAVERARDVDDDDDDYDDTDDDYENDYDYGEVPRPKAARPTPVQRAAMAVPAVATAAKEAQREAEETQMEAAPAEEPDCVVLDARAVRPHGKLPFWVRKPRPRTLAREAHLEPEATEVLGPPKPEGWTDAKLWDGAWSEGWRIYEPRAQRYVYGHPEHAPVGMHMHSTCTCACTCTCTLHAQVRLWPP